MKITNGSDNIFRDLGFGEVEAESLKLRSTLMIRITKIVRASNMTQADAASVFGVTQPRLNQLLKGKIQLFSLDALVNMLAQAGMRVNLVARFPWSADVSLMALHRFKAVTLTERNVSRSSKFDLDEFIDAGGMGFLQSGISRVHLRFFDGAASHLEETRISESQKLIHQPNGDVDLISDLPITEQLKWWIMGFGENVEVIAPVRLRTEIAKRLVAAAAHYISKG